MSKAEIEASTRPSLVVAAASRQIRDRALALLADWGPLTGARW